MNQSKIAVRYAKAFFQLAEEKKMQTSLKTDIQFVQELAQVTDFQRLMESPTVKKTQKKKVVKQLTEKKINPLTLSFLNMIIENKREVYLPAICRNFIAQYRNTQGIKEASITTATKLDKELSQKIKEIVTQLFKTEIELSVKEDKKLIGGFVLRVGDQQIDAGIATKLKQIERSFLNTTI